MSVRGSDHSRNERVPDRHYFLTYLTLILNSKTCFYEKNCTYKTWIVQFFSSFQWCNFQVHNPQGGATTLVISKIYGSKKKQRPRRTKCKQYGTCDPYRLLLHFLTYLLLDTFENCFGIFLTSMLSWKACVKNVRL